MRLEVRRHCVKVTDGLRAYLKERLRLALARFARHIGLVRVYLRGVNGRRGGPRKKCRVVVELPPRGRVIVAGADTAISRAIARTAGRAGFAVKRHVKRRRSRRPPPRPSGGDAGGLGTPCCRGLSRTRASEGRPGAKRRCVPGDDGSAARPRRLSKKGGGSNALSGFGL
jgi:ribosome-associated translation inhibitor RaiA